MSIIGYSGLPGSGKSYGVVENVILPALEAGRHVITNIPVKVGYLSEDYPKGRITTFNNADVEQDPEFWNLDKHPSGVIWVIDEAWRFWKSGMKSTHIPDHEKQFFTEHRHEVGEDGRTNEVVLVTQDLSQLCAFVRQLVEETYRAVKLTAIGQRSKYRVDVYMGAATGQNPGKPVRQLYGTYKPEVFKYYRSHTRNKSDFAAGMEEKADDRANILKSPFIKLGLPAAVILIIFSINSVLGYFDSNSSSDPGPQEQVKPAGKPSTYQAVRTKQTENQRQLKHEIEPDWLPLSDSWRIVGEVNDVYLIWGDRGTRELHKRNCSRIRKTGEPYCVIRGQLVTYYSYKEPDRDVEREGRDRQSIELPNVGSDSA